MVIIRDEPVFLIYAAGLLFGLSFFDEILFVKTQYLILVLLTSGIILAVVFKKSMPSAIKISLIFLSMIFTGIFLSTTFRSLVNFF
mgnify:CR=1 FL=1